MEIGDRFKGKKVTVMGLGLLGRARGDALFLARHGAELIITDLKSEEQLASSIAEFSAFPSVRFVLGEHRSEDFKGRDFVLKAAGVPNDSIYLQTAREEGTPVVMSASWFAEVSGVRVLGITGTRGKSTVTHMLNAIFEKAGRKVLLGGNVQGVSTLAFLDEVTPEHIAILELDSWQLQGFGEAKMSPHLSVFTTFFPDHLNYYSSMEEYLADKANIFLYQKTDETLVLGAQAEPLVLPTYAAEIRSTIEVVGEGDLPADWTLKVIGAHNRYNAALARAAALVEGIDETVIREALEGFGGVPGRLELVRTINGIEVYNDTNSTTPDATLAAIQALTEAGKPIILIMGGSDKGIDMGSLLAKLPDLKKVVLLAGTGSEKIGGDMKNTLESAVDEAFTTAEPGDAILFSPAFASFGMFTNEYDRGEKFNSYIETKA